MRLDAPLAAPDSTVARLNPLSKLGATLVVSLAVLASVDPVTAAVALVGTLAVLPAAGVRLGPFLRRCWPLLVGSIVVGAVNTLFSPATGTTYLHVGPFRVTDAGLAVGAGLGLRVLAIALPGVLAFATTDPTDLADNLVQKLRVPARFAIGALAAFRMMPLLLAEWRLLLLARRARGVDAGANPVARARLFASALFAMLVGAVRRGTRLATAMDARGFDANLPRSIARQHPLRRMDFAVLAGGVALATAAIAVSVAAGTFQFVS